MTFLYIILKNETENRVLFEYLSQHNYNNLTNILKNGQAVLTCIIPKIKEYVCSWSNPDIVDSLSKEEVVTLQQFLMEQEGRILL